MAATVAVLVTGLGDRTAFAGPDEQERYSAWVARTAIDFDDKAAGSPCPVSTVSSLSVFSVPVKDMPPGVTTTADGLKERVRVSGCGRSTAHNVLVYRTPTGVGTYMLMPGESLTSPRLMSDAIAVAPTLLDQIVKGACPAGQTTAEAKWGAFEVVSRPDDKGVWKERWPLSVCGVGRAVALTFTPMANGGTDFTMTAEASAP